MIEKKEMKDWGYKTLIFHSDTVLVERLVINEKLSSSLHKHRNAFNLFYVEEGVLQITIENRKGNFEYKLGRNENRQDIIISPGIRHKFKALTNVIGFEISFVKFNPDDIVRLDENFQ